ncbi:MAG: hypothetical protein ACRDKE_00570 [Solirubrobacterales bacterium]
MGESVRSSLGGTRAYQVTKATEPVACSKCSWQIDPSETLIVDAGFPFCSDKCRRAARFDTTDLGGES